MKRILQISTISLLLFGSIQIAHAQDTTLISNIFSDTNKVKWLGACQGPEQTTPPYNCKNWTGIEANMLADQQHLDFGNWIINSTQTNVPATKNGLVFKHELPGEYQAKFPLKIDNFQKDDDYKITFDLTGVYGLGVGKARPYLRIGIGDFWAHEHNDRVTGINGKLVDIETRNQSYTIIGRGDNSPTGKAYAMDNALISQNNLTPGITIVAKWKEICPSCQNGTTIDTELIFSGILVNNYSIQNGQKTNASGVGRFVGNDFVIHNLSVDQIDNTPPNTPTISDWKNNSNDTITKVKNDNIVKITLNDVEIGATVTIPNTTCHPSPATTTKEVVCEGTIGQNGFTDGNSKIVTITDPKGHTNTSLRTPTLIIDNEKPKIILAEIEFDNNSGIKKYPTETETEANIEIPLGNGINFDNFLAKIQDNIDGENNFSILTDIIFKGNPLQEKNLTLTETGNFEITFKTKDTAGNEISKILKITITENDKSALQTEIDKKTVKDNNEIIYKNATPDKKTAYDDALKKADDIKNNPHATRDEIRDTTEKLKKAYDELDGKLVDKTKLDAEIKNETIKNTDAYTSDTSEDKKNYDDALIEAKKVFSNTNATQQQVDNATKKLIDARMRLDGKTSSTTGPGGSIAPSDLNPVKETTPTKPITTADNQNIFKTRKISGQCVSIVKNLDEPRLIAYYTSTLDIASHRDVRDAVSRGEFIKMLFLASGLNLSHISPRSDIADVDTSNPYNLYISAGLDYGLIHGQTDGVNTYLRPNDTISRSEAAKIFIRAANLSTQAFTGVFSDVSSTLTLSEYIESAYHNCLLHGRRTLNGHPIGGKPRVFEPHSPMSIAETAKVLYNMTH